MYELRIDTQELKKALDVLGTVINKKMALPILQDVCIRFNREKKIFTLMAGNSEQWLQIDAVKSAGDGQKEMKPWMFLDEDDKNSPFEAVCISLSAMKEAFALLPTMPVRAFINLDTNSMRVDYGKGEFTMPVNEDGTPDTYPEIPVVCEKGGEQREGITPLIKFSIEATRLLPLIAAARCCSANDELRPVMNTVCLDCFHDHVVVVASDGHTLYKKVLDTGMGWTIYGEYSATDSAKLLLPATALSPLVKALATQETLTLTADTNRIRIESGDGSVIMTTVTIEGKYPNYESVIPKDQKYTLLLDCREMMASLRRITIFSAEASNMCILRREDDQIILSAADVDMGRNASEQVAIISGEGDDMQDGFEIGCKIASLQKLLDCISTDNLKMELSESSKPILLKEDDKLSGLTLLIMPMLVQ